MAVDDRPVVPVADFDRPLPDGINIRGRGAQLWAKVTELGANGKPIYLLRPDELVLLEEVCRQLDLVEAIDSSIAVRMGMDGTFYVSGVGGSVAADPLLAARRGMSTTMVGMLKQLALPDLKPVRKTTGVKTQSQHNAEAVHGRWHKQPDVGT